MSNFEWQPPSHGFISLLTSREHFAHHLKQVAVLACVRLGMYPEFDADALDESHAAWCDAGIELFGEAVPPEHISHIKWAGALLFALDVCRPILSARPIAEADYEEVRTLGLAPNIRVHDRSDGSGLLIEAFPNECLTFIFARALFNAVEAQRGLKARIDFANPPMTYHYMQNFCWYLRSSDPQSVDLYLIFKTMDLYSLELPRHEGRQS